MHMNPENTLNPQALILNFISWTFGVLFLAIGLVNTFWGNDTAFGIFIILLSFGFFPPVTATFKRLTGWNLPYGVLKFFVALFILWASLGVGELFDKIGLMLADFN